MAQKHELEALDAARAILAPLGAKVALAIGGRRNAHARLVVKHDRRQWFISMASSPRTDNTARQTAQHARRIARQIKGD